MDSPPLISIVIPALNEEKNISKCLSGILHSDYSQEKIEIIVVDNGSTDNTVVVAQKYGAKVISSPCATIGGLRNLGWRSSKGDYVAFLDADCIPDRSWLPRSLEILNAVSRCVAVSGVLVIDRDGQATSPWIERLWVDYLRSKHTNGLTVSSTLSSFCFVVPVKYLDKVNGFNETLRTCEDSDLGYRLSSIGDIIIDPRIEIVHLGNAKTLKEFFLRQLWHGRSFWSNLRAHKITLDEIPSIAIPTLYLCVVVMAFLLLFSSRYMYAILLWLVTFGAPLAIASRKKTGSGIKRFGGYFVIWCAYLLARGIALFFPHFNKTNWRIRPKRVSDR